MQCLGFHHSAIEVRDVERVAGFYRDVLGLVEIERHWRADESLRSIWLALGPGASGGFLAIEASRGADALGSLGFFLLALTIAPSERAGVLAHLAAQGVPVEKQTQFTVYVRDPEGNLVGLSHHPQLA
jgi:glyoxylase I family protein